MGDRMVSDLHFYCNVKQKKCGALKQKEIPYYDLTFVLSGSMTYFVNGMEYVLEKGDAMLLRPGTLRARRAGVAPVHFVSFNFQVNEGVAMPHPELMKSILTPALPKLVAILAPRHIYAAADCRLRDKGAAILEYVLLELLDAQERKCDNAHVIAVLDYVSAHVGEHIALQEVATHVRLSREYVCALFKREMGVTLTDYVNDRKLVLARELIERGDLSLMEAATELGFRNYHYFSRLFKQKYGVSPLSYRKTYAQV